MDKKISPNNKISFGSNNYVKPEGLYKDLIWQYFTSNNMNIQVALNRAAGKMQLTTDGATFISCSNIL